MLERGWVLFDRKITGWRWYNDLNTFKVFFHLIITANYEDRDFKKITVKRGQRIISIRGLAQELELSERNIRTALEHLEETKEIELNPTKSYTICTIINYGNYQKMAQKASQKPTQQRHTSNSENTGINEHSCKESDTRPTQCRHSTDTNVKKYNKDKKDKEKIYSSSEPKSKLGRGGGHLDF